MLPDIEIMSAPKVTRPAAYSAGNNRHRTFARSNSDSDRTACALATTSAAEMLAARNVIVEQRPGPSPRTLADLLVRTVDPSGAHCSSFRNVPDFRSAYSRRSTDPFHPHSSPPFEFEGGPLLSWNQCATC
jgi:hypothetical protein